MGHGLGKTVELVEAGKVWLVQGNKAYGRATIAKCVEIDLPKFLAQRGEHKVEEESLPYTHTYYGSYGCATCESCGSLSCLASYGVYWMGPYPVRCVEAAAQTGSQCHQDKGEEVGEKALQGAKNRQGLRGGADGRWEHLLCQQRSAHALSFKCLRALLQSHMAQKKCEEACVTCLLWQTNEARECGWRSHGPVEAISVKSWLGRRRTRKRRRLFFDRVRRGIGDIVGKKAGRAAGVGRGKQSESKRGYIEGCCNAEVVLPGKKGLGVQKKVLAKKGCRVKKNGRLKKKKYRGEEKRGTRDGGNTLIS